VINVLALQAIYVGNISTIRTNVNSQKPPRRNTSQAPLWMAQEMHPLDAFEQKDMGFLLML
jgi:hypothetical protein